MIHTVGLAYTKNDAHSLCGLGARALTSVTGATKKKTILSRSVLDLLLMSTRTNNSLLMSSQEVV